MSEDYRSIATMLGISATETQLIIKEPPTGRPMTIVLLQKWRQKKCRPCVTIGQLHTLLLYIGLVDPERLIIQQQLEKILIDNGHSVSMSI